MEASRPIEGVCLPMSDASCIRIRSSLDHRYHFPKWCPGLEPLLQISDSKLEMLEMTMKVTLHHEQSNLKFTKHIACSLKKVQPLRRCHDQKKRGWSYETGILEITEGETPKKTKLKSEFNLNIGQILNFLKSRFDHVSSLNIKEPTKEYVPGTFTEKESIKLLSSFNLVKLSAKELISLSIKSKTESLSFQGHLAQCSETDINSIARLMAPAISTLIDDRLGNYVIQRLTSRCAAFEQLVVDYCSINFDALMHDEYASRVMQCLIESRSGFAEVVSNYFNKYLDRGLQSTPAIHLVVACIKNNKDRKNLSFVTKWLSSQQRLFWDKGFQKILSAYILVCSSDQLDGLFRITLLDNKIHKILGCKVAAYFLSNMLLRNHQPTGDLLIDFLCKHPRTLFRTKCWRLLIGSLWETGTSEMTRRVSLALANLESRQITKIRCQAAVLHLYVYITLRSLHVAEIPLITQFLSRPDLADILTLYPTGNNAAF